MFVFVKYCKVGSPSFSYHRFTRPHGLPKISLQVMVGFNSPNMCLQHFVSMQEKKSSQFVEPPHGCINTSFGPSRFLVAATDHIPYLYWTSTNKLNASQFCSIFQSVSRLWESRWATSTDPEELKSFECLFQTVILISFISGYLLFLLQEE